MVVRPQAVGDVVNWAACLRVLVMKRTALETAARKEILPFDRKGVKQPAYLEHGRFEP
jgi:hypothetical protein